MYALFICRDICRKSTNHLNLLHRLDRKKVLYMSRNFSFYSTPVGAKSKNIEEAPLANAKTSVELVPDHVEDAFFFRSLEENNIRLNESQIEAVRHFDGPALCVAGAGSGKTSVLTSRVGYLISVQGVHHKNILLMTFTSKAAEEMKERIATLPGLTRKTAKEITAGTFHSIFYRLLKSQGYDQKVLSSDKQKQTALKIILKRMNLQDSYEPETLLALLSSYKNQIIGVDDVPSKMPMEKEIKGIFRQYEQWKRDNDYIDYDDMLFESLHLLQRSESLLASMQNRFKYILCDEWQDTNPLQYELIKMIAKPQNNLFVVGDDDQTIFSFNSADSSIILNFDKEYAGTKVITLDVNYRSTTSIVGLGNAVISHNQFRHDKTLKATKTNDRPPSFIRPNNTDDEAKLIIENIVSKVKKGERQYRDFAIVHRTVSSSRAIFDQLVLKDIPFIAYTRGETFYEQSIVRPVIDHLRLSLNPQDYEAISGITPTLYLNKEKTLDFIAVRNQVSPKDKLMLHLISLPDIKDFQRQQIFDRLKLIDQLKTMKPVAAVQEIRKTYDKYLEANDRKNITLHKEMINETLSEIESSAKQFDSVQDYIHFIDKIIKKNKEMEELPQANVVSLMTIHRSKGLEFPVVYLIGASEGILPHSSSLETDNRKDMISDKNGGEKVDAAIEEERRLTYVAITRAKEELYISSPSYYRGGQVEVSRFLLDPYTPLSEKVTSQHGQRGKEISLVWSCSNRGCNGWMRITTNEEAQRERKRCPICRSEMEKGEKTIEIQ
jgi:DNA helicase-2/ATP-dependent DNA helicase PcrA